MSEKIFKIHIGKIKCKTIIIKHGYASLSGHSPNNPNKMNQDSLIFCPSFMNDDSTINLLTNEMPNKIHFFGICKKNMLINNIISNKF